MAKNIIAFTLVVLSSSVSAGLAQPIMIPIYQPHSVIMSVGETIGVSAKVAVKSAVLRAKPDVKAKKLAGLVRGTKLQIIEQDGNWSHVSAGHYDGYVLSRLILVK